MLQLPFISPFYLIILNHLISENYRDSRFTFFTCLCVLVGRLPKIALKWMQKQNKARGRPKKNWMEGIRKAMNGRNLNEGQWEDRK